MAQLIQTDHYPIFINDDGALTRLIDQLQPTKVFVIVDTSTEQLCLFQILEYLPVSSIIIHIEQGEQYKNIETAQFIWKSLLQNGADRHSLVLNLGGGVIGDMGGFCAATYMRGIPFIQMPTTLLSQVDSSIGSKLGIDLDNIKNTVGVFEHPYAVIIYTSFLKSLPYKQLLSGYAEVIKHALIADRVLWETLIKVKDITPLDFQDLISKNIAIKNNVVSKDPQEKGLRKILNFGHTIGHALETLLLDTDAILLHGEAIAIGMVCESYISHLKGNISLEECTAIKDIIIHLFGRKYKSMPSINQLESIMLKDKKNKNGTIRFSLLESIGVGNYDQEVTTEEITKSLHWYKNQ